MSSEPTGAAGKPAPKTRKTTSRTATKSTKTAPATKRGTTRRKTAAKPTTKTPATTRTTAKAAAASKPAAPVTPVQAAKPPAAGDPPPARPRPETAKATLTVVEAPVPHVATEELKKAELIEKVVERSGIKKRDAKPVIEAMLAVLGETVQDGRDLNLKPFGKLKAVRSKTLPNGVMVTARLRRTNIEENNASDGAKEGLAKQVKGS